MGSEKRDAPGPAPSASGCLERTNLSQRAPAGIVAVGGRRSAPRRAAADGPAPADPPSASWADVADVACDRHQFPRATPVGRGLQTCPHTELRMRLTQEAEHRPRLAKCLTQLPQRRQWQAIRSQLPCREAHAALGTFDPEQLSPSALLEDRFA